MKRNNRCIACACLHDLHIRKEKSSGFDVTRDTLRSMCVNHKRTFRNSVGSYVVYRSKK